MISPSPVGQRTVFVSYRRTVSWATARLVFNDLRQHGFDVFMDVQSIDSGDFERTILTQIAARAHFLLLLEPGSLDRIADEGDWLRREIAHAIRHERNIIPVTANGFVFRPDLVLPPDISRITSFNAVSVPPEYFDEAMQKLRERFLRLARIPPLTQLPESTSAVASVPVEGLTPPPRAASTPVGVSEVSVRRHESGVVVTWSPVPAASSYILERMTGSDAASATVVHRGTAREYRLTGQVSADWSFRVRAMTSNDDLGPWSAAVRLHKGPAAVTVAARPHTEESRLSQPSFRLAMAATGLTIVALAIVLWTVVDQGDPGQGAPGDGSQSTTMSTSSATSISTPSTSTSTTTAASNIPVRLYNNGTIAGIAAQAADDFRRNGYTVESVDNYTAGIIPTSTVYYRPGTEEEAAAQILASRFNLRSEPRFDSIKDAQPGLIVIVTNDYGSR